jgi:hypothetical protein
VIAAVQSFPVQRVARKLIRPGVIVSTVIAAGRAETVTFTADELAFHHLATTVVLGEPEDAFAQHRRVVAQVTAGVR